MTLIPSELSIIEDSRGSLGVIEFEELPFVPQRLFWIFGVKGDSSRASHAHKVCEQFLFVQSGSLSAFVTDKSGATQKINLSAGQTLYLTPRLWLELSAFSEDAVLGVFASHPYDKNDYITTITEL